MKTELLIKLSNILNICFLEICRIFIKKGNVTTNNLLLIQTGGIGDLIVSSEIFKYEGIYSIYDKIYFLLREDIQGLFINLNSRNIEFIGINLNKFRYNLIYRLNFLKKLKRKNFSVVYNLTSARSAWNDALALCINAKYSVCNYNSWKTVYPFWKDHIHKKYSKVYNEFTFNEYKRIKSILGLIIGETNCEKKEIFSNKVNVAESFDIVVAPFSSEKKRDWSIDNFAEILKKYSSNCKMLIVCSEKEQKRLSIFEENSNIYFSSKRFELGELFTVIANSKIFIGLDSGITHIALKTKTNVIAIIGGGNFGRYLPKPDDKKNYYLFHEMDCFGCEWHCFHKEMDCIQKVSVQQVTNIIDVIIEQNENS